MKIRDVEVGNGDIVAITTDQTPNYHGVVVNLTDDTIWCVSTSNSSEKSDQNGFTKDFIIDAVTRLAVINSGKDVVRQQTDGRFSLGLFVAFHGLNISGTVQAAFGDRLFIRTDNGKHVSGPIDRAYDPYASELMRATKG